MATATPRPRFGNAGAAALGKRGAWRERILCTMLSALPSQTIKEDRRMSSQSDYVLVLTTLPADADAGAFARALVEARLAACVNLLPVMESIYRWRGAIERDQERQVVIKTSRPCVDPLWQRVRDLHSYEVPEFIVLPIVDGHQAYLQWIGDSTG